MHYNILDINTWFPQLSYVCDSSNMYGCSFSRSCISADLHTYIVTHLLLVWAQVAAS